MSLLNAENLKKKKKKRISVCVFDYGETDTLLCLERHVWWLFPEPRFGLENAACFAAVYVMLASNYGGRVSAQIKSFITVFFSIIIPACF